MFVYIYIYIYIFIYLFIHIQAHCRYVVYEKLASMDFFGRFEPSGDYEVVCLIINISIIICIYIYI